MHDAIIDACCLINLYASGGMTHFLAASRRKWYVPLAVLQECLYIRYEAESSDDDRERVECQEYVDSGSITPVNIEGLEESDLFIGLATDLDDGEAMALSIAKHRGWVLATDDRKARRIAAEHDVPTITTPEIMREWQASAQIPKAKIKIMLSNVETRGRFVPGENAAEYSWWMKGVGKSK